MSDIASGAARERLETASRLIREAGAHALRLFRKPHELRIKEKGLHDQATNADSEVEYLLSACLSEAYPEDRILGEESGASGGGGRFTWVVDPIDGTQCFMNGIPTWCVSMALLEGEELVGGVIFDPPNDELFVAVRGIGSTLNGKPITASPHPSLKDGVVGVGFSHRTTPEFATAFIGQLIARGGMFQRNGSGALMLAYVAAGRLLGYVEEHINAWDCLAGISLVENANGLCNEFLANDGLTKGGAMFAAGEAIAEELQEIAKSAGLRALWRS